MLLSSPTLTLCLMAIASSFPLLISCNPLPISPRSQVCSNAPKIIAGSKFDRRTIDPGSVSKSIAPLAPSPLHPRSNAIWCIEGTKTYLSITITSTVIPLTALPVLSDAYNSVYAHLLSTGDGLLPGGAFDFADHLMALSVWNSNNHQITWGVLGSALWGLKDFMQEKGVWGTAIFQIYDGSQWVASGVVGRGAPGG